MFHGWLIMAKGISNKMTAYISGCVSNGWNWWFVRYSERLVDWRDGWVRVCLDGWMAENWLTSWLGSWWLETGLSIWLSPCVHPNDCWLNTHTFFPCMYISHLLHTLFSPLSRRHSLWVVELMRFGIFLCALLLLFFIISVAFLFIGAHQ